MGKIVYIQPIFAPDRMRLNRNLESIRSFGNYLKAFSYDNIDIVFGGWSQEEYWSEIKQTIKTHVHNDAPIIKFDNNYGKATIVNSLYEKKCKGKGYHYILTADSDIIFDENCPHIIPRLVESAQKLVHTRQKPFGLLSLMQRGQCCHLQESKKHVMEFEGVHQKEKITWPEGFGGIAGGCLFLSTEMWERVNGYRIMGVYSGDDAYLLVDAYNNGFSVQVSDTIWIVHPHEHDQEYAQWKVKVCQRDSGQGFTNIKNQIDEANEFWRSKNDKN